MSQEENIRRAFGELAGAQLTDGRSGTTSPDESTAATSSGGVPPFRVNADDVSFLKSIGIDPTRTVRRRRKSRFSV